MKKLFTLLCGVAVAVTSVVAAPKVPSFKGVTGEMKPEVSQRMSERFLTSDSHIQMNNNESALVKAWNDGRGSLWTLSLAVEGSVPDCYTGWTMNGQPFEPTIEDIPFYVVTAIIEKWGASEGTEVDQLSVKAYWTLWWPSMYWWQQLPDYIANQLAGLGEIDFEPNYDIVPLDELCLKEANELVPDEVPYCHLFEEAGMIEGPDGEPRQDMPYPILKTYKNSDGEDYEVPVALSWGMVFSGAILDNTSITEESGLKAGNLSTLDFTYYNPDDSWIKLDGRMFLNETLRLTFNFDSDARIEGWNQGLYSYPELGEVHFFNRGETSSSILGALNPYLVSWGPLKQYEVLGCGKWITVDAREGMENAPFAMSNIQFRFSDEYDVNQEGFTDAQNYFYGSLFSAVDSDLKEEVWHMPAPYLYSEKDKIYTITPKEGVMVPRSIFEKASDDFWAVCNRSFMDYPSNPSSVNIGTTEGFIFSYFNGYNSYIAKYTGEIYYHYDENDMSKVKIIPAVGSLTPDVDAVSEIEAGNETPVYYNLQGVRVANPEKGLFIKVNGNKTSKVIF